jgi:hypothetical protein
MTLNIRKAALGLALAATTAVSLAASPAEARDRWGRHRGGGDDAAIAIAAGIAGLAIGAAVADGNHGRYYNDRRYYRSSYYYPRYRSNYYYYNDYPRYNGYYYNDYNRRYRYRDNYERRRWRDRDYRWGY